MSHSDHNESKTPGRPVSAAEAYESAQEDITNLLVFFEMSLKPQPQNIHWGHVGSLQHVRESLIEALGFISGQGTEVIKKELNDGRCWIREEVYPHFSRDMKRFKQNITQWGRLGEEASQRGDAVQAQAHAQDVANLTAVFDRTNEGNYEGALDLIEGLETPVRDQIPERLYNFIARASRCC